MKIAVLTDVHANLPALQSALQFIDNRECDLIVHTGDLIGIGPFPKECCDILLSRNDTKFVMGNHDAWFAFGLPNPIPEYMNEGEVMHHHWVHTQLDESIRLNISKWPYEWTETFNSARISFIHYGLVKERNDFVSINRKPTIETLDLIFEGLDSDIVFYGHDHIESDLSGRKRYINRGALGCHKLPIARFAILEIATSGMCSVENIAIEYDDSSLFQEFEKREVPEREFIKKIFFSR